MVNSNVKIPIETLHLFPKLDALLIDLLKSLTVAEWHLTTIAKLWNVKDIASHLLDGNLRTLSFSRDNYFGEKPPAIDPYFDIVDYLNKKNSVWVNATKRLSTNVLIDLLEITGRQFCDHIQTLKPFDASIFSVAWAGQDTSENWFHIAREYTEKFIHQQQIREAVGKQVLFTKELYYPFINTIMYGLPHSYRNTAAEIGTVISVKISTEIGGEWNIAKTDMGWLMIENQENKPVSTIIISPEIAWKLFSKGILPEQALPQIKIIGDQSIGNVALQMVSVMA